MLHDCTPSLVHPSIGRLVGPSHFLLLNMNLGFRSVSAHAFGHVQHNSTPRFVSQSVGWPIGHILLFFSFFDLTAPALPKIRPRDWGSRVSGLVQCS